jgi:hypothetical protein
MPIVKLRIKVMAYVNNDDYRKLRAKLALVGTSFSEWLREKMKQEVD